MATLAYTLFLLFLGAALMLSAQSSRRLSDTGRDRRRAGGWLARPRFGPRADFTPDGWRRRKLMALCQVLALIALLVWGALQST